MRPLAILLLPAAATALALATVSTTASPPGMPEAATPRPTAAVQSAPDSRSSASRPIRVRAAISRPSLVPRGRWAWPLDPRPPVARPFVRPTSTWGAGHRGVDLTSGVGDEVRAVDAGVVGHVGVVAGRGTVTVLHRPGLRSTYEPVDAIVRKGDVLRAGQPIGTVAAGGHCPPAACLHLGALRGATYVDPLTLLGAARVRLLPLH